MGSASMGNRAFLTFGVGSECLALPVRMVEGIQKWSFDASRPASNHHTRGAMVFDDQVVPILDLRSLRGLPQRDQESGSVVIVIRWTPADAISATLVGCLVDQVFEVFYMPAGEASPRPSGSFV